MLICKNFADKLKVPILAAPNELFGRLSDARVVRGLMLQKVLKKYAERHQKCNARDEKLPR